MPNRINELLMKEYKERFAGVDAILSVGYQKLSVNDTNAFRGLLEEQDIRLSFVKNRIVKLVCKETDELDVSSICQGQTAFAVGAEDPVTLARTLFDFRKKHKELEIHGAMVENTILDAKETESLSKSPNRVELQGMIAGAALSPGSNIAGALMGPASTIAGQIKAMIEEREEEPATEADA